MVKFRNSAKALKDPHTAYIIAAFLAFALIISKLDTFREANEMIDNAEHSRSVEALYECADALRSYSSAERNEDMVKAVLLFENACLRLELDDRIKSALLNYAGELRYGVLDNDAGLIADELLFIAETDGSIDRLCILLGICEDDADAKKNDVPMRYLRHTAMADALILAGDVHGLPDIVFSDNDISMSASNLFISFSKSDGSFDEFFFLHSGKRDMSNDIETAARKLAFELTGGQELECGTELCGYRAFCALGKNELVSLVYDSCGRLSAAVKVKR